MVKHMVCALLGHQALPLLRAGCADHSHARGARELYGCNAYTATCAVHKEYLARTDLRALEQTAIGSCIGYVDCRALGEGGALGEGVDLRLSTQRLFGIGTAD